MITLVVCCSLVISFLPCFLSKLLSRPQILDILKCLLTFSKPSLFFFFKINSCYLSLGRTQTPGLKQFPCFSLSRSWGCRHIPMHWTFKNLYLLIVNSTDIFSFYACLCVLPYIGTSSLQARLSRVKRTQGILFFPSSFC